MKTHPALDEEYGDLFDWHHVLTGSCEFGRRQWCEEHGYKPTDSITLRTFLTETVGANIQLLGGRRDGQQEAPPRQTQAAGASYSQASHPVQNQAHAQQQFSDDGKGDLPF